MLKFLVLIFSLLCYTIAVNADDEADNIPELTDSNYESTIAGYESSLVMFYAPWCGHCKRLKPDFSKAAQILLKSDPPVHLVKVDCTEGGKQTCNANGVSGYPTLKIFRFGRFIKEYNGPRNADGIVKFMKSQVGPGSKPLNSADDVKKLTSKDEAIVVGYFKDDSELKKSFLNVADKLREKVTFGHAVDEKVAANAGFKSEGVKLIRSKSMNNKFEDSEVEYSGQSTENDIESWVTSNYHGLVGLRTSDNAGDFKQPLVVAYYNVDYTKNPKGTNYWRNRILKVAKGYQGQYNFAISSKDDFQNELNEFGFDYSASEKPLVTARDQNKQKYVMKDEFSVETFEKFMKDLSNNNLEAYLKSEAVPADNSAPVKVAVAKNFDELITNNGKDTLIEFYAPWCGHCKKLAPVFDELGEKLKNEEVVIAKMDATANDVPAGFDVRGFPTLYWIPRDARDKPVRYEGGRELDDFVKYIAGRSSSELQGFDRNGKAKEASSKDEL